jgi:hypothetical protein
MPSLDVIAVEQDLPLGYLVFWITDNGHHQRGLAAPVRPKQGVDLPVGDDQVEVVKYLLSFNLDAESRDFQDIGHSITLPCWRSWI